MSAEFLVAKNEEGTYDFSMSFHRLMRKLVAIALPNGFEATLLNSVLMSFDLIPESLSSIISNKLPV